MQALLKQNYAIQRKRYNTNASEAFRLAKCDASRGRISYVWQANRKLSHGDILRKHGRTFVIAILQDDDASPPWERSEGHGTVTDWTTRDKEPGELVLNEDGRSKRYYDFAAACATARKEWGLSPDNLAELETRLGRKATAREIASEAARRDFDFLRAWCNDEWHYVGVVLFEIPRGEIVTNPESFADKEPFAETNSAALWGIESCADEYIQSVIMELFHEI